MTGTKFGFIHTYASSVIYVETAIQHSKHREHSSLPRGRGARKAESVKTARRPKTARSASAEERSPHAVDPDLQLITGGGDLASRVEKATHRASRGIS